MTDQLDATQGTRAALELVSGKWTILVVFELSRQPTRPSELLRAIPGASPKMLSHTLKKLERHGLVDRTVYPTVPPRVEYRLTPLGRSLLEPLLALCRWVDEHWAEMAAASQHVQNGAAAPTIGRERPAGRGTEGPR